MSDSSGSSSPSSSKPNNIPPAGSAPPPAPSTSAPPTTPTTASSPSPSPSSSSSTSVPGAGTGPSSSGATSSTGSSAGGNGPSSKEPLTGFRSSLEHTGIPRSVLLWKPRLPSRNWTIFLSLVGTISYLYYHDRSESKRIKAEYIDRVSYKSREPTGSSLDLPRKVLVIGAKWPEDDDEDRALRYFRKYLKPYLVAAAVDYEQLHAPLHGSITRQIHAASLARRRQALGLEPVPEAVVGLPGLMTPQQVREKELEGGTVIVGRHSLKEYMEGLKRGWLGRVDEWDWEKSIGQELEKDGFFDLEPKQGEIQTSQETDLVDPAAAAGTSTDQSGSGVQTPTAQQTPPPPSSLPTGLSFLSRPAPPRLQPPAPPGTNSHPNDPSGPPTPVIPEWMHQPPSPLPPQPPVLLVPFVSRLGFKQVPWMMYDFFTERYRVKAGAEAALALIEGQTRPFTGPASSSESSAFDPLNPGPGPATGPATGPLGEGSEPESSDGPSVTPSGPDTDFHRDSEKWYKSAFAELPQKTSTSRAEYEIKLRERLQDVRDLAEGKRQLTPEEEKSTKPLVMEQDLKEERRKKELRWKGTEEGYEIIRPGREVTWDPRFEGWLRVFRAPSNGMGTEEGEAVWSDGAAAGVGMGAGKP